MKKFKSSCLTISLSTLLLINFCTAQSDNELIKYKDLIFKDELEQLAFDKYYVTKDTNDALRLLFSNYKGKQLNNYSSVNSKINTSLTYLKNEIEGKPEIKKVKIIYNYIHEQFLKVYKLNNSFTDIFESGEYNCVSASALYAIIFSKLSIPYQIKETPEHVYLVAYPNTVKILVETTAPTKGYYQFNSSFVNNFVNSLYESKIISKEEFEKIPASELFNTHFFTSENISLNQLAGIQYSNYALYSIEDNNFIQAYDEIKKAYYIFPNEKNRYILKIILSYLLEKNSYDDSTNVWNLPLLCRFNNLYSREISKEEISHEFYKFTQTILIKNSDYYNYEKAYLKMIEELNDSSLKNEIIFDYHYELARLGYLNSKNLDYELEHLSIAYDANPLNANLRALIMWVFDNAARKYNDSESIIKLLTTFINKFDFLTENTTFSEMKAKCILDMAYQNYFLNNVAKGDDYLKEFESLMNSNKDIAVASFIEKAYSQGAACYYKKGNFSKAKQILKAGLIYAPNSFGLQQRLNQIK